MATTSDDRATDVDERDRYPLAFGTGRVMWGRIEHAEGVVVLALAGEFDLAAADDFASVLAELEAGEPPAIVIDPRRLDYMDSTGISGLLAAARRAAGARLFAVMRGTGPAYRALELAGIDERLLMLDDLSELPLRPDAA
jgi:anti-anti-sigma factor